MHAAGCCSVGSCLTAVWQILQNCWALTAPHVECGFGKCCLHLQLLAMVPQPVLAVLLLFPITQASEEADKQGVVALSMSMWLAGTQYAS